MMRKFFENKGKAAALGKCRIVLAAAAAGLLVYLLAAPNPWTTDDQVKIWGWLGGLAALAGIVALSLTASWWLRSAENTRKETRTAAPRWFWPLVVSAAACTACMGWMRLDHDFWADEELTLRMFVQGSYKPDPQTGEGAVIFKEFGAGRAFHHYRLPNNHILHSVMARLSVGVWKIFREPGGRPFSETATRMPAFFFGVLSVVAMAILLKEMGFPRAGVIAAFLFALHPWHLRMASEARGYSMIIFFLPTLLYCWLRALKSNAWKWWSAVGALQLAIVYTNPSVVFPVILLAVFTVLLVRCVLPPGEATLALLRYLVCSASGALLFILLFAPCIPQFHEYLQHSSRSLGTMGTRWFQEFGSYLFSGMSWFQSQDPAGIHPELHKFATASPALFALLLMAASIFAVAGVVRAVLSGPLHAAVVAVLALAPVMAFAVAKMRGWYLYEWYLVYALCGAEAFIALGFESVAAEGASHKYLPWGVAAVFLVGYFTMTRDIRSWVLTKSLEPMTDSVLITRPTILPNYRGHSNVVTASFCQQPNLYDPHMVKLKAPADLTELMASCEQDQKPLFINIGGLTAARTTQPEMAAIVLDSPAFEIVARLPGWEPYSDRVVARFVGKIPGKETASPGSK